MNIKTAFCMTTLSLAVTLSACGGGSNADPTAAPVDTPSPVEPPVVTPPVEPPVEPPSSQFTAPQASLTPPNDNPACLPLRAEGNGETKGLYIAKVAFIQPVEQDATDDLLVLAANKATKVRVDLLATGEGVPMPQTARIALEDDTGTCTTYQLTTMATEVPTSADNQTLANSYVADIPALDMSSKQIAYAVAIDTLTASKPEVSRFMNQSGSLMVASPIVNQLNVTALTVDGMTGELPATGDANVLLQRMMPHENIDIITQPAFVSPRLDPTLAIRNDNGTYVFSEQTMRRLVTDLDIKCFGEQGIIDSFNSAAKCVAPFPQNVRFETTNGDVILGLASSLSMVTMSFNQTDVPSVTQPTAGPWLTLGAETFIHEFGHLNDLGHANCGNVGISDPDLYSDGSLGGKAGFDFVNGFYFSGPLFSDIMSYCSTAWMSDKGYRKVIGFHAPSSLNAQPRLAPQAKQTGVVAFKTDKGWMVMPSATPPSADTATSNPVLSTLTSVLGNVSIKSIKTDLGQLPDGPYFFNASPVTMAFLKTNPLIEWVDKK